MVEGPKYHRHAELLAAALRGLRLRAVLRAKARGLSSALSPLVGCRVLRVFAVGKELFIVFGIRWNPESEGSALRLHFGHGGGYVVEHVSTGAPTWGPKAAGGGHRREQHAQLQLEFEACVGDEGASPSCSKAHGQGSLAAALLRLLLWDELGSVYDVAPPEYLRASQARAVFDINAAESNFATATAVKLFTASEELVVDLIMDQSRLPGVGNIIKCEGLYEAAIHPLRRARELSEAEWVRLLQELRDFSDRWYRHCQLSDNGQMMGCSHLMKIYGHWTCAKCSQAVNLIKEGTRQRITYFCPTCQPSSSGAPQGQTRAHRHEKTLPLPCCSCGELPALLQVRAGNYCGSTDDRRPYLSCPRRHGSSYDDGGCGVQGSWDGCGFYMWLDEAVELPRCQCGEPGILRRVVGLRENGRYFVRCAAVRRADRCSFRCWLRLRAAAPAAESEADSRGAAAAAAAAAAGTSERRSAGRWRRRTDASNMPAEAALQEVDSKEPGHVGGFIDEFSSDPVTSGEEDSDVQQAAPCRQLRPPETGLRQKRWKNRA
mmetsp:Transcript_114375/g.198286  ORF Transcript_114375/g.198286 Transcript_114375/m.198286 type:complete len:546 (-) Transcript_114375:6-1643(-)